MSKTTTTTASATRVLQFTRTNETAAAAIDKQVSLVPSYRGKKKGKGGRVLIDSTAAAIYSRLAAAAAGADRANAHLSAADATS